MALGTLPFFCRRGRALSPTLLFYGPGLSGLLQSKPRELLGTGWYLLAVYVTLTAVAAGEVETFRNLEPKSMLEETKKNMENVWTKKIKDGYGTRPAAIQASYEMKPETPVAKKT